MARAGTSPKPWTVEEFLAWEREQEERYGTVFAGLRSQLRGRPCHVFVEAVKVVSVGATMDPDVVVTCTPGSGRSDVVPEPEIGIEVPSRSTRGLDRGAKLDPYQRIASLKHYALIAQDEVRVGVYERDDSGWRYHVLEELDANLAFAIGGPAMTLGGIYERATVGDSGARQGSGSS